MIRSDERAAFDRVWDVLVVGAGPSGLFASLALAVDSAQRVLLIDAGPDVGDRRRDAMGSAAKPSEQADYTMGVGGAGLFSDGKLCLSLEVGGGLKDELAAGDKQRLLDTIGCVFEALLDNGPLNLAPDGRVPVARSLAEEVGLHFKFYPVFHIGTERCGEVIRSISQILKHTGTTVLTGCELVSLRETAVDHIKEAGVRLGGVEGVLRARRVVLGMGKVGASRQQRICESLGIKSRSMPMYLGVRLETRAEALRPLFELSKDPKYSMTFPDGSKIKTHCATDEGQVLCLTYDGFPLAGGHNFHCARTGRSGFSMLWDGVRWAEDSYRGAMKLMAAIGGYTGGGLLVQTLSDYRRGIASSEASICGIPLSNPACKPGDVRDFLPPEYFEKMEAFLERLARLAPRILCEETVLFAPSIEWWMRRVEVRGPHLETSCPGIYVCGDGSGWSQGIVHSAATGLLVAEGISGRAISRSTVQEFLRETCTNRYPLATGACPPGGGSL